MPFTSGSQGAQTNCASVFMGTLDTALLAAGFQFVEQVVNATVTSRIYKSPAASNFFGSDWFLIVKRSSDTATNIDFSVTEQYNSTTHLCFNYAPSATSGLTPTATFAVNDAAGKAPDSGSLKIASVTINTTGFAYWFSLFPDRVALATRVGSSDYALYAGLYDDLQALAISPFPLMVWPMYYANVVNMGAATREPNTLTPSSGNFGINASAVAGVLPWWTPLTATTDPFSGKAWLSRARIPGNRSPFRGLLRDVWVSPIAGVNGDTVSATISGTTKTLVQMSMGNAGTAGTYFVDQAL